MFVSQDVVRDLFQGDAGRHSSPKLPQGRYTTLLSTGLNPPEVPRMGLPPESSIGLSDRPLTPRNWLSRSCNSAIRSRIPVMSGPASPGKNLFSRAPPKPPVQSLDIKSLFGNKNVDPFFRRDWTKQPSPFHHLKRASSTDS